GRAVGSASTARCSSPTAERCGSGPRSCSAAPEASTTRTSSPTALARDSRSVTAEEWARCWRFFGPWVTPEEEAAGTVVNRELNAPGLALRRGFDVVDQLARVDAGASLP